MSTAIATPTRIGCGVIRLDGWACVQENCDETKHFFVRPEHPVEGWPEYREGGNDDGRDADRRPDRRDPR